MKNKNKFKKIISLFAVLLIVIAGAFAPATYCDTITQGEHSYKSSNVMDDLNSSTINGVAFNINDYPVNNSGTIQMISLVEYAYNAQSNLNQDYALYVYIYNPAQFSISVASSLNQIELTTKFDTNGNPITYNKYNLKFISKCEIQGKINLFYKFKVTDAVDSSNKKIIDYASASASARKYNVSSVELLKSGYNTADDYDVGFSYTFTGYAAGYDLQGSNTSTLQCNTDTFLTIPLNVQHTNFRTQSSSLGVGHQNEINSVYFSVDNDIIAEYGNLQKIKAEWYEYKTNPIIVINDQDIYNDIQPYLLQDISTTETKPNYDLLANYSSDSLGSRWTWRYGSNSLMYTDNILSYLFITNCANVNDYTVSNEDLEGYIDSKNVLDSNGIYVLNNDLFQDDIDLVRREKGYQCGKIGKNVREFDASVDKFNLLSYDENHDGWDRFLDYFSLSKSYITNDTYNDITPIEQITYSKINSLAASTELFINEDDVPEVKLYVENAMADNQTTYMFRFADTDYFTEQVTAYYNGISVAPVHSGVAYKAEETIFEQFDIITLTFLKNGTYTEIPVVSNPLNIINAVTPGVAGTSWAEGIKNWFNDITSGVSDTMQPFVQIILAIIGIAVLIFVVVCVIKIIAWIADAFKGIRKRK